jgi:hypothetical protein
LLLITGLVAGATAISQVAVLGRETDRVAGSDSWAFLPAAALVALSVTGFALVLLADLYAGTLSRQHPTNELV